MESFAQVAIPRYFCIPDYQRDYEWTNRENSTLAEDIFNLVENPNIRLHFVGAIVTIPYRDEDGINKVINFNDYNISTDNVRFLLDGQQRFTSLMIFIATLRELLSEDQFEDMALKTAFENQLKSILFGYNWHHLYHTSPPKLILNSNTGLYFNNQILGLRTDETPCATRRGARRIKDAKRTYIEAISKAKDDFIQSHIVRSVDDFYERTISVVTNKLKFEEIKCEDTCDAFQIFESLNGKGLDLSASDRIKNIFMSWASHANQPGALRWDSLTAVVNDENLIGFFNCLMFYNDKKRVSRNQIPDRFKAIYQTLAFNNFSAFFQILIDFASVYSNLRECDMRNNKLNDVLQDFVSLKTEQVYNILFAVTIAYRNTDNFIRDFTCFASKLQSLIVRMQICGKSANRFDSIFANLLRDIEDRQHTIIQLTDTLQSHIDNISDESFKEAFTDYSTPDRNISEFYLRHIENYYRQVNQDAITLSPNSNLTVEHIIPQSLPNNWYDERENIPQDFRDNVVERIGNKALLFGPENASAGNRTYLEKVDVYREGIRNSNNEIICTPIATFHLISKLVEKYPNRFTHEEVNERARELAEIAAIIWS